MTRNREHPGLFFANYESIFGYNDYGEALRQVVEEKF